MITKKHLIFAVLCTVCLTMVLFSTMPVKSAGVYDPWIDVNHDGKINVLDLIKIVPGLTSSGDPALNVAVVNAPTVFLANSPDVTVANWPSQNDVNVFWNKQIMSNAPAVSGRYPTYGYTYLHVLVYLDHPVISPDIIYIVVGGILWNSTRTAQLSVPVYTARVNETEQSFGFTIPVPSKTFYFNASTGQKSGPFKVSLSYYLTWG